MGGKIKWPQEMEQQIRDRYREAILQEAMHRYGIANGQIRPINTFENFIYEFERGPGAYILRIAHSLRRHADRTRSIACNRQPDFVIY